MIYFLTSSPFGVGSPCLNPANQFIDLLKEALPTTCSALFVCSDPTRYAFTDHIALDMKKALEAAGFSFTGFQILDARNVGETEILVRQAGLIVLAGGHVPTQNAFFQRAGLRQAMREFHGVLIGISAGSMNSADIVYAQPEEPGEAISPTYKRFLPGLGVTDTMLLPHYQMVKDSMLDGMRLFEDITFADSQGHTFYVFRTAATSLGGTDRKRFTAKPIASLTAGWNKFARQEEPGNWLKWKGCALHEQSKIAHHGNAKRYRKTAGGFENGKGRHHRRGSRTVHLCRVYLYG